MKMTIKQICEILEPQITNGEKSETMTPEARRKARKEIRLLDFENGHPLICKMKTVRAGTAALNYVNLQRRDISEMLKAFQAEISSE